MLPGLCWLIPFPSYRVLLCCAVLSRVWLSATHGLLPTRILCPQNFLGQNTRVDYHLLYQRIFLTQGSNPCVSCVSCIAGSSQLLSLQIFFSGPSLSLLLLGPLQWECWCILCCPDASYAVFITFSFSFFFYILFWGSDSHHYVFHVIYLFFCLSILLLIPSVYHSSLFGLKQPSPWLYRLYGSANGDLQEGLCQEAHPRNSAASDSHLCREPLLTHTSTGDPPILAGRSGVTVPFPWVLVHVTFSLCPPRVEFLFPPVLWKFYNQILLAFKIRFPGDS